MELDDTDADDVAEGKTAEEEEDNNDRFMFFNEIAEEVARSNARFGGWADLQHFVDQRKSEMNQ